MKKIFWFCCCTLLVLSACTANKIPVGKQTNFSPREGLQEHIQKLCSEKMAGREGGERGEALAALYLAEFLQKKGLKPAGEEGTYFQSFPVYIYQPGLVNQRLTFHLAGIQQRVMSENVLALLDGQENEVIVVSAHYDHLGTQKGKVYPGANDNASGVAVVLEIINRLAGQKPAKTILFAFWGSEEKGLLGSRHFCENPLVPLKDISCIINLDSVGNLAADRTLLVWKGEESDFSEKLLANLHAEGWNIVSEQQHAHSSDHVPFAKKRIPGFTLLSSYWLEKNHTPEDIIQEININYMEDLTQSLVKVLK